MKNRRCLLLYSSLFFSLPALAQHALNQARHFDTLQLREWKGQRAFQYQRGRLPQLGLWDRLRNWLWRIWQDIMDTDGGAATFWTIAIVLSVAVIAYMEWKYRGNTSGMWSKADKGDLDLESLQEENIHEINFEEKIAQAIDAGKYRLAIRLRYLHLLKVMDGAGVIKWQAGKTNYDYILEVRATASEQTYTIFRQISTAFDFAWYGEHDATAEDYGHVKNLFDQLQDHSFTTLKKKANERV